jgi:predicted NBD/HSP70 family sugar kinase
MNEKLNHLGIDVGKRKCRAALKDDKGRILDEFFFGNDANGILDLLLKLRSKETRDTQAVLDIQVTCG